MKLLLALTSLFFSAEAMSLEYKIKSGDTLYSIAKENDVDLIDLYNSNKVLGLKPDKINIGDYIYLPNKFDRSFSENCYFYSTFYEFSLKESHTKNLDNCINFLSTKIDITIFENDLDDFFWDKFNSSEGYTYFAVNMFLKSYELQQSLGFDATMDCPDFEELGIDEDLSKCKFNKSDDEKKYLDILLTAAKNGNLHAFYFWNMWEVYYEETTPKSTIWKLVWDEYDLDYLDSIAENKDKLREFADTYKIKYDDFCERELYQMDLGYDLKFYSLISCLNTYGRESNTKFVEFFHNATKFMLSNTGKFISYNELKFSVNSSYYLLNANFNEEAFSILNNLKNRICPDCSDSQDLIQKFFDYSESNDLILGQGFYEGLLLFDLNYTNLIIKLNDLSPEAIRKIRKKSIEQYKYFYDLFNLNSSDAILLDADNTYASILSDYAMSLSRWGLCDEASRYQNQAQKIYENLDVSERYSYDSWNEFHESIRMADCYLSQSKFNPDSIKWNESSKKAEVYIKIAEDFIDTFNNQDFVLNNEKNEYVNQIDEALLILIKLANTLGNISYDEIKLQTNQIRDLLSSASPGSSFGRQGQIIQIKSIYTKIYFNILNLYNDSHHDNLLDPIDIFNYESNLFINNKIINLKVSASQNNLKILQNKLDEKTKTINEIKSSRFNDESYEDLLSLYKENAEIVTKILSSNEKLNQILVNTLPNISEIKSTLNSDEFALFFVEDESINNGAAILITKDSLHNYEIDSKFKIERLLKNIKLSLTPNTPYDYESAKKLYDMLFKPIESIVPDNSTVYLLSDIVKGINPWILVREYNNSDAMTDFERMISTDWLIKRFNIVKHFQIPKTSKNNKKYDKKFLGYGNSTTYEHLGLPNLYEVNEEIKELALLSNGSVEDILIKDNATKSKLIKKLNNSYERVVISTHAVDSFWRGLTSEPALIFNNDNDDFFLTPSEIINLDINSDMIILSSCSSSIYGFDDLFKSFLLAGAESVIYTNWELESKYANEFTTNFMKELWFSSDSKHEALRKTSLSFINNYEKPEYSHPAFWGNFSIVYSSIN